MKILKIIMLVSVICLSFTLVSAETRYFAVKASNAWGDSGYSEELAAEIPEGSGATIAWNAVSGATRYKVYWGKTSGDYFPAIETNTTSYTFIVVPPPTGAGVTVIP